MKQIFISIVITLIVLHNVSSETIDNIIFSDSSITTEINNDEYNQQGVVSFNFSKLWLPSASAKSVTVINNSENTTNLNSILVWNLYSKNLSSWFTIFADSGLNMGATIHNKPIINGNNFSTHIGIRSALGFKMIIFEKIDFFVSLDSISGLEFSNNRSVFNTDTFINLGGSMGIRYHFN